MGKAKVIFGLNAPKLPWKEYTHQNGKIGPILWVCVTLRERCPYSEFFRSVFPAFGLNTDQKNSEYGHFSRCVII